MLYFENLTSSFPILGIIFSLILFLGFYQIGSLIFTIKPVYNIFKDISEIKYQKIFLSINLILLIFYPLILYIGSIYLLYLLGFSVLFFGIYKIFNFLKKFSKNKFNIKKNNITFDELTIFFVLLSLFFLSMSPNTHGDSLGYHFVVAKSILKNGNYPLDITHIHTLLAGSGELLISIGMLFGSEQFGSMVQYSGLFSIFGIFKRINSNKKYFFLLLAITSPVIIFLSSTAKPQLFHACASAVVFSMYFITRQKNLNNNEKIIKIFISLTILLVSFSSKFNFLVSAGLLGSYILYNSFLEKNLKYFILIFLFVFIIFYFPIVYFKYLNLGGAITQYFFSPLPTHLLGMPEFQNYLIRFARNDNIFELIFPISINRFTNSIGLAFIFLLFLNYKNKFSKITLLMVIIYFITHYFFGQFIGRTFLEPLIWVLLISANYDYNTKFKFFEYFCRLQSYIVIVSIIVGVYNLFPGSLSKVYRDKVLSNHANGYSLFKWANSKLTKNDVAFSWHRSISLGNAKYLSPDLLPYVNFKDKRNHIYVEKILKKNPKYFLAFSAVGSKPNLSVFKYCLGKLLYFEENLGQFETRNPFNRGYIYSGYIYEFKIENFPNCAINPKKL